jgi:hypothetical protein
MPQKEYSIIINSGIKLTNPKINFFLNSVNKKRCKKIIRYRKDKKITPSIMFAKRKSDLFNLAHKKKPKVIK